MDFSDLLLIHPAWQAVFTLLGLYAAWLGIKRLRSLHLGGVVTFPRSRHIVMGKIVICALVAGAIGGMTMVRWAWRAWFITGPHAWLGLSAAGFLACGLLLGLYLQRRPAPRKALPLAHGLVNLIGLCLCLAQFVTGSEVLHAFVLGE